MTIKKNHLYSVEYKGKWLANYSPADPLNKAEWILTDHKNHFCPLPDRYLKQLVNDTDVKIIDMGAF